jgi:hypothetical protein
LPDETNRKLAQALLRGRHEDRSGAFDACGRRSYIRARLGDIPRVGHYLREELYDDRNREVFQ